MRNPVIGHVGNPSTATLKFRFNHSYMFHTRSTADVKRFRGGLVFKTHRRAYRSTLGLRVMKKKKKDNGASLGAGAESRDRARGERVHRHPQVPLQPFPSLLCQLPGRGYEPAKSRKLTGTQTVNFRKVREPRAWPASGHVPSCF